MTLPNSGIPIAGAYCNEADLTLGDITIGPLIDKQSFIRSAADEINLALGRQFVVPVTYQDIPANYLLKTFLRRVNAQLATGRLLMALATNIERDHIHTYAQRLVTDAQNALRSVLNGTINLPALVLLVQPVAAVPQQWSNQDEYSGVDAFYNRVMPGGPGVPLPVYKDIKVGYGDRYSD